MAGIKVPQYKIFKIGTNKLKYSKWDLHITEEEAFKCNEVVRLFQGQDFRLIAKILGRDINEMGLEDFMPYICAIVIDDSSHFKRVTSRKGVTINGITYKRFVGTSGGLKKNTLIFVNESIIDELMKLTECGRKTDVPIVPAKLETYRALTCSASQPICDPNGILVVSDCLVNIKDTVIKIDDSWDNDEPEMTVVEDMDIENNASDGFNLCTIDYMRRVSESLGLHYTTSGVCLRNAWLKGMLYPFPIVEFFDKYKDGNYKVKDIWGNEKDIRECEMILTESSLKCWNMYDSIEDYITKYHENGYEFAVTKVCPEKLEDQRELNYQYLQSYDFTDEDIKELCSPTVKYLEDSLCGDYESTLRFLGIYSGAEKGTWQEALTKSEYMMKDPFIIESVNKMIKRKIDDAKIGKIFTHGNYQIVSGDPFALLQHIAGLEVTGLLKANECYSYYWHDVDNADELVVFRSPMTAHNNIRKVNNIINDETNYWYQYMQTVFIFSCCDTICQSLNGMDSDGDLCYTTNNKILLNRHNTLPAILCVQRNTPKVVPTEEDILKSNKGGMGNKVGSITNRITGMMEVLTHFEQGTKEYETLMYRIACGQLYQQNEIDKIKGIKAKEMPTSWYNYAGCKGDEFLKSICSYKKPYFMIYVYDDYKREFKKYLNDCNQKTQLLFGKTLDDIINNPITDEEKEMAYYYNKRNKFGMGACAMNRICWYIENVFNGKVSNLKKDSNFNYTNLLYSDELLSDSDIDYILSVDKEYRNYIKDLKSSSNRSRNTRDNNKERRDDIKRTVYSKINDRFDNKGLLYNTMTTLYYKEKINRQFYWDCVGNLMSKRLEELNECNN